MTYDSDQPDRETADERADHALDVQHAREDRYVDHGGSWAGVERLALSWADCVASSVVEGAREFLAGEESE